MIPVDAEPLGRARGLRRGPAVRLPAARDPIPIPEQDAALDALERRGTRSCASSLPDRLDLGAQFFVWEFATAVAGAVLGVNPFDQPDVEASKVRTRELTAEYEQTGALPGGGADPRGGGPVGVRGRAQRGRARAGTRSLDALLCAHLGRVQEGDYVALLPYIQRSPEHERALAEIRAVVRDRTRAATCVGFGPRFLHSTGQATRAGRTPACSCRSPATTSVDLEIPGNGYSFGVVKAAQARGDLDVLAERGRRALRLHIGLDVEAGLRSLGGAITRALSA